MTATRWLLLILVVSLIVMGFYIPSQRPDQTSLEYIFADAPMEWPGVAANVVSAIAGAILLMIFLMKEPLK